MGPKRVLHSIWQTLTRTKSLEESSASSRLKQCLTTLDLTVIGIGSISGVGIYILTGAVVRDKAGPATFLSFAIAGFVALLNAMCYAELGCRIPRAGSAYTFTYVTTGELPAFIIGWSLILEYVIGSANIARGWSSTIDALTYGAIRNGTIRVFGSFEDSSGFVSEYPDLLAGGVMVLVGIVLMTGAKLSSHFNLFATAVNMAVLLFMCIVFCLHFNPSTFAPADHGGFFPYSFTGVIGGSATLFYSYIGFDTIVVSVEEAKDPKRSIPRALVISLVVVTSIKIICSLFLVLTEPWWEVDVESGFVIAFRNLGLPWAATTTGVGSLFGISAVLLVTLFGAPRIIFAMANDGVLFRWLGCVWSRTKVPFSAICFVTPIGALAAIFFDIETLADFISIGTLIAYVMVALSVLRTRYKVPKYLVQKREQMHISGGSEYVALEDSSSSYKLEGKLRHRFKEMPFINQLEPGTACMYGLVGYTVFVICFTVTLFIGASAVAEASWWAITSLCVFGLLSLFCVFILAIHEPDTQFESFHTPLMPYLPCLTVFLNLCLILSLPPSTWLRYSIWLAIGLLIYFVYGTQASSERKTGGKEENHILAYTTSSTYS